MKPQLKDLNIGEVYAENEIVYLNRYERFFYEIDSCVEKFSEKKRFVIIGRKGTGKTLLASYMCDTNKKKYNIAKIESLKNFVVYELKYFDNEDISTTKYAPIFEWMIYINIAKELVSNKKEYKSRNIDLLKEFIIYLGHYGSNLEPQKIIEMTKTLNNDVKGGVRFFNMSINGEKNTEIKVKTGERSYLEYLPDLKSCVHSLLNEINEKPSIIFYDELDDKFSNNDNYKNAMISFLSSIESINKSFKSSNLNIKVCAVIRSDIINMLHAPNINRIFSDNSVLLDWDSEDVYKTELFEMLAHKFRQASDYYHDLQTRTILSELIAEEIEGEKFRYYIIHRTLGRPRDLIRMFSFIIEDFGDLRKFESYAFSKTSKKYSEYLKKEMSSELSGYLENDEIDVIFKLLQKHGKRCFTYNTICKTYDNIEISSESLTLTKVLELLFRLGAIANVVRRSKSEGGDRYLWSYNAPNMIINQDGNFEIHPGLWDALHIIKPKNRFD